MAKAPSFIALILTLIVISRAQIGGLNDLISCASYAKQLYGQITAIQPSWQQPTKIVLNSSKIMKFVAPLLSSCGLKGLSAAIQKYLPQRCISILELQATLSIKILDYKFDETQGNKMVALYNHLAKIIRSGRKKYCFKHFPQDVMNIIDSNECMGTIKDKLANSWNSLRQKSFDQFLESLLILKDTLPQLQIACYQSYISFLPPDCQKQLMVSSKLLASTTEYNSIGSWLWYNVSQLKSNLQALRKQCPSLLKLLVGSTQSQ